MVNENQEKPVVVEQEIVKTKIKKPVNVNPEKTITRVAKKRHKFIQAGENLFSAEYIKLIAGKNIAIMANQTAKQTIDRLIVDQRIKLKAIFAPEHGFSGDYSAGDEVINSYYQDIPVYGRYGGGDELRRIPKELLEDIDVLLFEIQDIGTRHYTFISSLYLAMDSAADAGIPFLVIDRPVAVNGLQIEGPVLQPEYQTFVGIGSLPNRYAMTIGELALLFKNENQIMNGPRYPREATDDAYYNIKNLDLSIVPMKNYNRALYYDQLEGIPAWIPPSPNIPNIEAALCYVGTGLLDGNSIREMVTGYNKFDHIAFPFITSHEHMEEFIKTAQIYYDFPGVKLKIIDDDQEGRMNILFFDVIKREIFNPTYSVLALMYTQARHYPEQAFINSQDAAYWFKIIHGNDWFLNDMLNNCDSISFEEVINKVENGLNEFKKIRQKYLLY